MSELEKRSVCERDHGLSTGGWLAREAMLPWLGVVAANPSSVHREGVDARYAVEKVRKNLTRVMGADATDARRCTRTSSDQITRV